MDYFANRMNVVMISPHFPPNYYRFCERLRDVGANVLAVSDADFGSLRDELRNSITYYYRVSDMHNHDELVRALGFLTHKFGKLDRLESHNEYWLETDARLRTDFNIDGIHTDQIAQIKRKSEMKKVFQEAGLSPARGKVCKSEPELRAFVDAVGYPIVAKPDTGVGAYQTYKISNKQELDAYIAEKPPIDYIIEEFIAAQIVSFDGLVDKKGDVVFSSSLRYNDGVMEVVNADADLYYYFVRDIEPAVEQAGLATLKAFGVKERFFHFEFFLHKDGNITPMEVNLRPPGGLSVDMFNYMWDFDCYRLWAEMLVNGTGEKPGPRKHFVMYVGRKLQYQYELSHDAVLHEYGSMMVHHERIADVFARAIGSYGYILRGEKLEPLLGAAQKIQQRV